MIRDTKLGEELFKKVSCTINHDRQDSYGTPEDSFDSIAKRWTEYINNRICKCREKQIRIQAKDVAFMMMELKMARESNKHKRDNIVDLVGYTVLMDEMEQLCETQNWRV